jgi:asparagine synthase (glutamine-hydrolysing)
MSAIAGIICLNSAPADITWVETMTTAMRRRGPDAVGHWLGDSAALGHCMLRATPESLEETQPLLSEDGKFVLVMDGRLDNREELRQKLLLHGVTPRSGTDAELVLGAYSLWGEDSPKQLLGDFAYAVWDTQRQCLFCVLDTSGARPFYYVQNQQIFAFASEDEALLGLPGVSGQPNEGVIAHALLPDFRSFDNQYSWWHDIQGIAPGQSITVFADGNSQIKTYWQLEVGEEHHYSSDQECEETFLAVFGEAVRCRLRSVGHPAAMMSGGMDSASIAAMVRRLLPEMPGKRFHTYSAIADDPAMCVESCCIQSLTKGDDIDAHFVSVPSFQGMFSVDDLTELAWSKPHPCDGSLLLSAAMCQAASRQGERVLLHGVSGDITMYVPRHYMAYYLRAGQWRKAWQECKAARSNNTFLQGSSLASLLLNSAIVAWTARVPSKIKTLAYRRLRSKDSPWAQSVINPRFAARLQLADHLQAQQIAGREHSGDSLQQIHLRMLESRLFGLPLGLTIYERVAGRYGIELRDPWADRRVVEFFLRLPLKYKVRNGWSKYLARTAFSPNLDRRVCWRLGKENLGWQFIARLMGESDEFVSSTLKQNLSLLTDYVDINTVRLRYEKYQDYKDYGDQLFVYEIAILALWMQRLSDFR